MNLHALTFTVLLFVTAAPAFAQTPLCAPLEQHALLAGGAIVSGYLEPPTGAQGELVVESDGTTPLLVRVTDSSGRVVDRLVVADPVARIRLGDNANGRYWVEIENLGTRSNSFVLRVW